MLMSREGWSFIEVKSILAPLQTPKETRTIMANQNSCSYKGARMRMDQRIRHIICEGCGKRHIVSVLRGDVEMHLFTCPHCGKSKEIQGFLEAVSPEREKTILDQMHSLHLATWLVFGLSTLCCTTCCGILFLRPDSFSHPDMVSILLAIALNGSWYLPVIGLLLMSSALIQQGLRSHKLITALAAFTTLGFLYIQSRYFIVPENLTLWLVYLGAVVVIGVVPSVFKIEE